MTDRLPFPGGSDVQGCCPQCAATSPPDATSCSSCGAELGSETVIDDPRRSDAVTSESDTAPNGTSLASGPASALPSFADMDEEMEPRTSIVSRGRVTPSAGSSSDPPTRFLRGIDEHIELPTGSVVDDYEVDAKLGAGAMGVVYSARHMKLGRRVAIKVIAPDMGADPQALARFEREARTLASLHHPNIVDVYSFGTLPDERSYFAMEYLSGSTLYDRLQRGRVPLDETLDVLGQIACGLEAAHAQGIVHRDLKPENVFLQQVPGAQRAVVKLLDWGLARLAISDGAERTASGAVIGTALYLSPEQARGPNVDGRTDIYALGVVAYELVLGQHPFPHALTSTAALAAHLTEPPPQPRTIWAEIPAALDLLLYSMIAKDANYRPTLAQVRSVIASLQSGTASEDRAPRATTAPVGRGAIHVRLWMGALVALALVIGIAIGARVLGGRSDDDKPRPSPTVNAGNEPEPTPRVPVTTVTNDALAPVVDADVVPAQVDAPAPDTTKTSMRPKTKDAAITNQLPSKVDAGAAMEPAPVPDPPVPNDVDVARPPITPNTPTIPPAKPPIEGQPQRPVPTPPSKPPGRNDTINPFAKKGSAAR